MNNNHIPPINEPESMIMKPMAINTYDIAVPILTSAFDILH
jgi:hypothetical protein